MIFVLHGENLTEIRKFIINLQNEHNVGSKVELFVEETSPAEFNEAVSSIDMFGGTTMVVLDISKAGRMKLDDYIAVLEKVADEVIVIIVAIKDLTKTNVFIKNSVKLKARVVSFKVSTRVFKFVDAVFNGNREESYKILRELVLEEEEPIYILSMLIYGLRNIGIAKLESPELNKMAPFIKSKAVAQARKFSEESVKDLYEFFYELDRDVKIGKISPEILVPLAIEKIIMAP